MAENAMVQTYRRMFGGDENVGRAEAGISTALGLALAAAGLRKADARGLLMGLGGALLVARGMSRHCPAKAYLGHRAQEPHQEFGGRGGDDYARLARSEEATSRPLSPAP